MDYHIKMELPNLYNTIKLAGQWVHPIHIYAILTPLSVFEDVQNGWTNNSKEDITNRIWVKTVTNFVPVYTQWEVGKIPLGKASTNRFFQSTLSGIDRLGQIFNDFRLGTNLDNKSSYSNNMKI